MAYRERGAWITLVTTVVVYGGYFFLTSSRSQIGAPPAGLIGPFIAAVATIIVLQVGLTVVTAAMTPSEAQAPLDERERLIQLRSTRAGFYALHVGVFFAITTRFWGADGASIANWAFLAVVVAEIVRSGSQVVDYRRLVA